VPDNVAFVKVGLFENTKDPVPTSFVTAVAKFVLVGEAKNDATPVPNVKASCFPLNV
jgi:hypothetical protein